ncbi:MAG: transglycosylase SLT domain-containing protein [Rubrivivax sp.]|jgi:membrane-bound lytic murein transglycosylase D
MTVVEWARKTAGPGLGLLLTAVLSACSSVPSLPSGSSVPEAAEPRAATAPERPADNSPTALAALSPVRPVEALQASSTTSPPPLASATAAVDRVDAVQDPAPSLLRPAATASLRTLAGAEEDNPGDRSDLWERVRRGFAMPDLDSDLVRRWEQWYATRPDYVQRMTDRGGRYLFHVVEEVHKRGLPMELALLPFIESAFNPQALSVASASGMWQFMPATGRQFELKQNLFRDDRRDVLASTRAALDYLQMLHRMFGDWHLALAAYNWGQGNVQRALERNRRARGDTVYTALRMPDETRNYVPKLQAVKNIIADPVAFGLTLPALENHPFFLTVSIERDMDVDLVARLAGVTVEEFRELNPQLNKPVLLAAGTPQVLLPYDNANRFVHELAQHQGPLASLTAWVAPRTLRLAEVAKLTSVPEGRLRELNHIPDRMLIKAGSALIVPRRPDHALDVTEEVADRAAMQLTPDGPKMVRRTFKAHPKGESLASFARRHGVDAADLARWNKMPVQTALRPGQAMTMMSPAPAPAARKHASKPPAKNTARTAPGARPAPDKAEVLAAKPPQRR